MRERPLSATRIVGNLPRYWQKGRPFPALAFRIARNAVIDNQGRPAPIERLGAIAEPSDGVMLEALCLHDGEIRELRAAIRSLTPHQQGGRRRGNLPTPSSQLDG